MSLNYQKFSDRAHNEIYVVSTCEGSPQTNSDFYLNICPFAPHICDWLILEGKIDKKAGENDYIVHIMSENGLSMHNIVIFTCFLVVFAL